MAGESMQQETGVFPEGPHTAWSLPNGTRSEVRKDGKVVKRLRGEMSWSDAIRIAGDLNNQAK